MSCFYQHASLPFTVPYQRKPPREGIFHSHGPNNPLLTLTFIFSRPFLLTFSFHAYPPPPHISVKLDQFTAGTGRQTPASPPPVPWNTQICTHGCVPEMLLYWLNLRGVWGDDKDDSLCGGILSAAATRNLFWKNRILYTMVVGVKKGGTY